MKRTSSTTDASDAVGPYSQATTDGSLVFTAGQIPLTPDGELLDDEPIATQAEQSLSNIEAVLASEGLAMNDTYAGFFDEEPPARNAVEIAKPPRGVGVEIEAIATSE